MRLLLVLLFSALGCGLAGGQLVSKCDLMKAFRVLAEHEKQQGLTMDLVAKIVCHTELASGFNTSVVTELTPKGEHLRRGKRQVPSGDLTTSPGYASPATRPPPDTKPPPATRPPPATKPGSATKPQPTTRQPLETRPPPATKPGSATKPQPTTRQPLETRPPPATKPRPTTKQPLGTKPPQGNRPPPATKPPPATSLPDVVSNDPTTGPSRVRRRALRQPPTELANFDNLPIKPPPATKPPGATKPRPSTEPPPPTRPPHVVSNQTEDEPVWTLYGLFQLSNHLICSDGTTPSPNICKDDISCVLKVISQLLIRLIFQPECSKKTASDYFAECL
ncbi:hypothetical protein FQN60_018587 [Etheostoma spectabile]|uniref:Lysozyme n=1 Tax=Etheostoma spectabile TaxID=54343 RepID=A0A5J5DIF1_9PERO|nr:hypothetical protein FQN60_018587 [Etheostoma spectabile]